MDVLDLFLGPIGVVVGAERAPETAAAEQVQNCCQVEFSFAGDDLG